MRRVTLPVFFVLLSESAQAEPSATEPPAAIAPVESDSIRRDMARQCFSVAVSLARAGRYAAAKALFLEAYAAEPHHLALYNIAQAEVHLGELKSAANYLRQFLASADTAISPEWRQEVAIELERIEAGQALAPDSSLGDAPHSPPQRTALLTPETQATSAPAMLGTMSPPDRTANQADEPRLWGYVLTISGFALVGGAVGVYMWNHERHNRWQREHEELLTARTLGVSPDHEHDFNGRLRENNSRLASIKSFDAVPIITASVGMAAMGAGAWTLIRAIESQHVQLSSGPTELELQVNWSW